MIHAVTGLIVCVKNDYIVIETITQIQLLCKTPYNNTFEIGSNKKLFISFNWNQEHGPSLIGFLEEGEKELFEILITCPGIGPKAALAILSTLGFQGTINALAMQNPKVLAQTPGIGIKKAELMIIELKNKIESLLALEKNDGKQHHDKLNEVIDVLRELGYQSKDISFFNNYLLSNKHHLNKSTPEIIQIALTYNKK